MIIRPFIKIDNRAILFWSWNSRQYGCNPKAISDYILSHHIDEYNIYWSFKDKFPSNLNPNIIPLKWGSWKYIVTVLKCKFLISNTRNDIETMLFYKRPHQIYIMTWHGGVALKKIERDSVNSLEGYYLKRSRKDSKMCDLMLSGSKFQTQILRNSFWYDGEILERGIPRDDLLFKPTKPFRDMVCYKYSIDTSSLIILYAPTFRTKFDPGIVYFDWSLIKSVIENRFQRKAVLLVRLHPNIHNKIKELEFVFNNSDCIDVTSYQDMQELLMASDILITDYSSSMFDFLILNKPCFLLAKDLEEYDRGFYFKLSELPFMLAKNDNELKDNIATFDQKSYDNNAEIFNTQRIESFQSGKACEFLYNWISKC